MVTAACLLTRKEVYLEVGGFDEINLRIAMNDVDYCLKVRERGLKVIWTPFAELYHLESASRAPDLDRDNIDRWTGEFDFMRAKWKETLECDPYYNPNLTIADEDFALAHPPRLARSTPPLTSSVRRHLRRAREPSGKVSDTPGGHPRPHRALRRPRLRLLVRQRPAPRHADLPADEPHRAAGAGVDVLGPGRNPAGEPRGAPQDPPPPPARAARLARRGSSRDRPSAPGTWRRTARGCLAPRASRRHPARQRGPTE